MSIETKGKEKEQEKDKHSNENEKLVKFIIDYYKGYFQAVELKVDCDEMPFRSWAMKSISDVEELVAELKDVIEPLKENGIFVMHDKNGDSTDEFAELTHDYSLRLLSVMYFIGKLFDTFSNYGKDPLPNGDCLCGSTLENYLNKQFMVFVKEFVL